MTSDRAAVLTYLFICAASVGYWLIPSSEPEPPRVASVVSSAPSGDEIRSAERPARELSAPAPERSAAAPVSRTRASAVDAVVSSPALRVRLSRVLSRGTDLTAAAADFTDATQFAAVAHASRNTGIPFMLLKDRVVHQRMTLADAIRASKPDVPAEVAADLAVAAARSDLAEAMLQTDSR